MPNLPAPQTNPQAAEDEFTERINREVAEFVANPEISVLRLAHAHAERMAGLRLQYLLARLTKPQPNESNQPDNVSGG